MITHRVLSAVLGALQGSSFIVRKPCEAGVNPKIQMGEERLQDWHDLCKGTDLEEVVPCLVWFQPCL